MYNKAIRDFINPFLTKDKVVLEYGSGQSTKEIAEKVKTLVSMEHTGEWFETIKETLSDNATLIFAPSTGYEKGTDGTYEQFKDYIEIPESIGTFDVIIIDGRARVGCAKFAKNISHKDTVIFIHDYDRKEYQEALKYLTLISQVDNMAQFKIK